MQLKRMRRCFTQQVMRTVDNDYQHTVYVTPGRGSVGAALRRYDRIRVREERREVTNGRP